MTARLIEESPIKILRNSVALTVNNTTGSQDIFQVTGSVYIHELFGVVTTVLGANHTAGHFRLDDGTAQVVITLATGTTFSALAVGGMMIKDALATVALTKVDAAAGAIDEPAAAGGGGFSGFLAVQKTAGVGTHIEYRYATTDAPHTGVIDFFATWEPKSTNGNLTAA